jgi:hypothetical protein
MLLFELKPEKIVKTVNTMKNYGAMDLFKLFYGLVINDINIKQIFMELILREVQPKIKNTFTISRKSIDFQPSLIVELKSDGFSGFGEATSNPYYKLPLQ